MAGPYEQQIAATLPEPNSLAGRQASTFVLSCAATAQDILLMQFLEWRDPICMISHAGGTALAAACAADFANHKAGSNSVCFASALWLLARGSRLAHDSGGLAGETLPV